MEINVPLYNAQDGLKATWELGFEIDVLLENGAIKIVANKTGLISLATQLLTLAQDKVPSGFHFHYDEFNSLCEGAHELIIQKK